MTKLSGGTGIPKGTNYLFFRSLMSITSRSKRSGTLLRVNTRFQPLGLDVDGCRMLRVVLRPPDGAVSLQHLGWAVERGPMAWMVLVPACQRR